VAHVTEIQVHASAGFNHPFERFANFKPGVTLRAVVAEGENAWEETRKLQTLAESLVQAEKTATLQRLTNEQNGHAAAYRAEIQAEFNLSDEEAALVE